MPPYSDEVENCLGIYFKKFALRPFGPSAHHGRQRRLLDYRRHHHLKRERPISFFSTFLFAPASSLSLSGDKTGEHKIHHCSKSNRRNQLSLHKPSMATFDSIPEVFSFDFINISFTHLHPQSLSTIHVLGVLGVLHLQLDFPDFFA